jgi:hypothetical protein
MVYELIARSGLPFQYTPWKGKLANLPLKYAGLAWVQGMSGGLHLIAFDGKLVVDNNVDRVTWVYDHVYAKNKVFALFLLPNSIDYAHVPKRPPQDHVMTMKGENDMTKKDYTLIAAAFARTKPSPDIMDEEGHTRYSQWRDDLDEITLVLQQDNPRFDVTTFNCACGV